MLNKYIGVITRFLRKEEKLIVTEDNEMPLVLEANTATDVNFLKRFLTSNSTKLLEDIAKYGAILLRGFDITSDVEFEETILSIQGFRGISDAFMSEQGRIHADNSTFVLHTNAVYKTGGTLYLGGFHSENYYSADVPSYICFCCLKPSSMGGETGLIHMGKVYQSLNDTLKQKLEKNTFFVSKWLISEVAERYNISIGMIEKLCNYFDLPIIGNNKEKFILMYKPSIFIHPLTHQKSLQINLFEISTLNSELRKCFRNAYHGKAWFWHRLIWRLPNFVFSVLEFFYVVVASLLYSPKESFKILLTKYHTYKTAGKKSSLPPFNTIKVGNCFNDNDVKELAKLMRQYYVSCLWKKGDILLVDNRQVMHAGMPGSGKRLVRAMICNAINMRYSFLQSGCLDCNPRTTETIGFYMASGDYPRHVGDK